MSYVTKNIKKDDPMARIFKKLEEIETLIINESKNKEVEKSINSDRNHLGLKNKRG